MTRPDLRRSATSGLVTASLINVAMYDSWKMVLDPARSASFGYRPTAEACWAAILVCLLAFAGGALLQAAMGPAPSRAVRVVSDLVLLGGSLLIVNVMRPTVDHHLPQVNAWLRDHGGGFLRAFALLLLVTSLGWRRWMAHQFYRLLLILSPFLLVTTGRAVAVALSADFAKFDHTVPSLGLATPRPGMRVVVLVFDELDFNYAFTSRPASLRLPAFDSLRQHAFFATDAHAPARATGLSIPSYLLGMPVDTIIAARPGVELVHATGDTLARDLAVAPGLFDDAAQLGARSAVVGFHIPYCRLAFARLLERCTWRPISRGGLLDGPKGLPGAVRQQLLSLVLLGNNVAQVGRIRYLEGAALGVVSDTSLRLAFIHLPVPHFPPVWDERHQRFTVLRFDVPGYFANLALADLVLGRMVAASRQAGLQDRTVFVVTSDHPWRLGPIRGIPPGTTVPFMVRFPDDVALEWPARFETVRLRALVRLLLSGGIHDAAGVAAWAAPR